MMRRLIVLACLACAPALAVAQGTVTVTESNDQDNIINIAECQNSPPDRLAFAWTPTTTAAAYDLYVSDQSGCPGSTNVSGGNTNAHTISVQSNIIQTSRNQGDTAAALLNAVQIPCLSPASAMFVCVFATGTNINSGTAITPLATGSVQLDLVSPPAPVLENVSGGDGSLTVSWSVGSGSADAGNSGSANSFRVYYVPADGSSGERYSTFTGAGTTSGRVTGLQNNLVYNVAVTALTIGNNESPRSTAGQGTPVEIRDFWRLYQNDGGRESGGCATGAAGLAALVGLAPLAFRRRRKRP